MSQRFAYLPAGEVTAGHLVGTLCRSLDELVVASDGTAALVQAAAATWSVEGGWDVCERIVLASETTIGGNTYAAGTYRLVRYTGARPSALSSYAVLYAAGVAEAVTRAGSVEGA